jgi:hypothetical protein
MSVTVGDVDLRVRSLIIARGDSWESCNLFNCVCAIVTYTFGYSLSLLLILLALALLDSVECCSPGHSKVILLEYSKIVYLSIFLFRFYLNFCGFTF